MALASFRMKLTLACGLGALVAAAAVPNLVKAQGAAPQYDLLIKNAHILDGTGNPWFLGDIAVKDGKIAAMGYPSGPLDRATAKKVIDAKGLVASPGFFDMHTHSDISLLVDGNGESHIRDGVTTEVLGEGGSVAPRDGLPPEESNGGIKGGNVKVDWTTFPQYFARLKKTGTTINVASSVGDAQIRRVVMGYSDAPATPEQMAKMEALARRSMEEGAVGLVSAYDIGGPSHPDEVIALAKIVASYGGYYSSHIGTEGLQQKKEMEFAFRVAREAHIPVHIFHLKLRGTIGQGQLATTDKMAEYIKMINDARAEGLDITANQYPYTAMQHGWSAYFPVWTRAGGPAEFAKRLKDPANREKIEKDQEFIDGAMEHGGWDGIVAAQMYKPEDQKYIGLSIAQIAKLRGDKNPADTDIALMANEDGRVGGVFHDQSEDNVEMIMKQPWVAVCSDSGAINLNGQGQPHPRAFGTSGQILGHYVRETHTLTLAEAVHKMTGLSAQIMGIHDRGILRPGNWADIVLFDPNTVTDTATYDKPFSYTTGIPYVAVNGQLVIDNNKLTGARPGEPVLGKGAKQSQV